MVVRHFLLVCPTCWQQLRTVLYLKDSGTRYKGIVSGSSMHTKKQFVIMNRIFSKDNTISKQELRYVMKEQTKW